MIIEVPIIKKRVDNIVSRRMPTIVARALVKHFTSSRAKETIRLIREEFNFSIEKHSANFNPNQLINPCTCTYCKSLKEYTHLKLSKHRLRKRLFNDYIPEQDVSGIFEALSDYDKLIEVARLQKNELCQKLNVNAKD